MKINTLAASILLTLTCATAFASGDVGGERTDLATTKPLTATISASDRKENEVLFSRLLKQESGGRQFGKNGQPLTSSKGAVGAAQIMPATAPEAARLAGMEWSEWRYRNDAGYNMALGRAYLDSQLERYDGNNVLAFAAYNAGPGRVDEWLKTYGDPRSGQISDAEFIRSIPFSETQAYVSAILHGQTGKYTSSLRRSTAGAVRRFEFRDTHPGFTFSVAVNQSFGSGRKWVGGL